MTLYSLLLDTAIKHGTYGLKHRNDPSVYHESMGKMKMCNELIGLLSDETLKMAVTDRTEAITKGDKA